jgi:hypothetical protein
LSTNVSFYLRAQEQSVVEVEAQVVEVEGGDDDGQVPHLIPFPPFQLCKCTGFRSFSLNGRCR